MKGNDMKKYYAGIGSRETPTEILEMMQKLALKLKSDGYILRSGGAGGADSAFAKELNDEDKQIFLPWYRFNGLNSEFTSASPRAFEIAKSYHPAWERCSAGVKKLHARNVYQVLGPDIEPKSYSKFVVCWTRNAERVGGTATAIKIAEDVGIPVYNLANKEHFDKLNKYIND